MNRKAVFNDFLEELGDAFEFDYEDYGSTVGDPCFLTNDVGNDLVQELTENNFDSVMVFINNFTI